MSHDEIPVLLIHGLWLHPSSWAPWIERFTRHGYAPIAPGWPGVADTVHAARANPQDIADKGIDDVVEHYATIIDSLPSAPILVGHGFGGMIAQRLLGMDKGRAAVAIDAAQIKGVLPLPLSTLHATLPVFRNPANRHRAVSLTNEQFRYSFGNALSRHESDDLYAKWAIPAPGRPLFEAASANFGLHLASEVKTANDHRSPLLLVTGSMDHTVSPVVTMSTFRRYRKSPASIEVFEFADRGHSLTIDSGWEQVADAVLHWLAHAGLRSDHAATTY